jgi:hypothetical protein
VDEGLYESLLTDRLDQALADAPIATLEVHPLPEKLDLLRRRRSG